MSKKKVSSFAKNSKESLTRTSAPSLRTANTSHQRRSQSAKQQSVQNSGSFDSSDKLVKSEDDQIMPSDKENETRSQKIKFNSRDRSKETCPNFSPRLKSFPAEEIRRLDNSPTFSPALIAQQNPRETGTFFAGSSVESNNGYGDAATSAQLWPMHRQSKPPSASNTNPQQVASNYQPIDQTCLQSESFPTGIASPEKYSYHPFAPNVFPRILHDRVHDRSLGNPPINQPVIIPSTQQGRTDAFAAMRQAEQPVSDSIVSQNEAADLDAEYERQSAGGGRNAVNYRQIAQTPETIVRDAYAPSGNRSPNNCQGADSRNAYGAQPRVDSSHQIPQRFCQQSWHNGYRQQTSQQALNHAQSTSNRQQQTHGDSPGGCYNRHNQQLFAAQIPERGMTSPQDATVSQMRLTQNSTSAHRPNFGYPIDLQTAWPQNDRWLQTVNHNNNQQHTPHQQPPPYWRYYCQTQNPEPGLNYDGQNSMRHSQSSPSQDRADCKLADRRSVEETDNREDARKKMLRFTPDMMRDQELLVSTMKQQNVPDNVMRRQFDALLNEQRRQLAYIAQFQQPENNSEAKRMYRFARRIMEGDEKPEWMVHITPSRISYNEMERMKAQRKISSMDDRCPTKERSPEDANAIAPARQHNYPRQKKEGTVDRVALPQQMYYRMDPHQLWQQRITNSPYRNDNSYYYASPCLHPRVQSNAHYQPKLVCNGYNQYQSQHPYNVLYDPYRGYLEREKVQVCSKEHEARIPNSIDDSRDSTDAARFNVQNGKLAEPSSLLKIRLYKEVIRPQKRNNGLQDLDVIQKKFETLQDPASKKGLEYLANLARRKPTVKLNGAQDPGEIQENMQSRPCSAINSPRTRRMISANGLENSRNPDNPQPRVSRPGRTNEPMAREYPRQKQNLKMYENDVRAERDGDAEPTISGQRDYAAAFSHPRNVKSLPCDRQDASVAQECCSDNATYLHADGAPRYSHMHQCHINRRNFPSHNSGQGDVANMRRPDAPDAARIDRAGGDNAGENSEETTKCIAGAQSMPTAAAATSAYGRSEVQDARNIGCDAYLAGKPNYVANNLVISPSKLIASRHLQPPMLY